MHGCQRVLCTLCPCHGSAARCAWSAALCLAAMACGQTCTSALFEEAFARRLLLLASMALALTGLLRWLNPCSGSYGQVYRGTMGSRTVAVKVGLGAVAA